MIDDHFPYNQLFLNGTGALVNLSYPILYTGSFHIDIQNTLRLYGLPQALFSHGPSWSCLIYLLENTVT